MIIEISASDGRTSVDSTGRRLRGAGLGGCHESGRKYCQNSVHSLFVRFLVNSILGKCQAIISEYTIVAHFFLHSSSVLSTFPLRFTGLTSFSL